jgi:hypothetical protein
VGELMEIPMCFLLGGVTNVSKKIVDGRIKVATSNKHKKKKGCTADIIHKKHEKYTHTHRNEVVAYERKLKENTKKIKLTSQGSMK